ncbi:MAG: carboxymuconolactone decarboxylase family protein [Gemmatimonadota bacterium]|nr:MAG: carboxymuconolactone decarboxylase family protein [Gemmatimonadota bacterium]
MIKSDEWIYDLVDLAAAQAARDSEGMHGAFARLHAGGRDAEVEEAILQSYLFLGFPSAIETFRRWRAHGVDAPEAAAEEFEAWIERGEQTCATVYGDHYERLRENIARFHPDLDRWMVLEGYGKVLSRAALSLGVREMLIIAMLVVQGASGRRQLRSHLQGALNAGVAPGDIETTIRRAAAFGPPQNLELALELWAAVRRSE